MEIKNTILLKRMQILLPDGAKVNEPKLGDIFTFSIKEGEYMFGRVIAENPTVDGFNDLKIKKVVIYVYKNIEHSKNVDISKLTVDSLLLPPLILNTDVWKLGYLEIIDHEAINDVNVHNPICFDNKGLYGIDYADQWGEKIEKQEICGLAGLSNLVVLESKLCNVFDLSTEDLSDKKENFIEINISEHEGTYSLSIDAQENITKVFEAYGEGLIGNGYDMQFLFKNIIKNKNPKLLESIEFDSEANMFCLNTKDKNIAEEIKSMIIETLHNENAIMTEIKNVPEEDWD